MTRATPGSVLRFADFEVRIELGELRRFGYRIKLQEKPFQVLVALLERPGELVTRKELYQRLWSQDTFVDFDHNLNNAVEKLRKVLNDSKERPRFVETVPRRGYRFVAIVDTTSNSVLVPSEPLPKLAGTSPRPEGEAAHQAAPRRWRPRLVIGSWLTAVLLIALAIFHFSGIRPAKARASTADAMPIHSIVIEKNGGVDPLDEGFKLYKPQEPKYKHDTVLYNRETNGWDRWRIRTDDQNYYYRPLSTAEKEFVLQRDWKLTCVCALEGGAGFTDVDFGSLGGRFDIEFLQEDDRYFVALTKQISPKLEWTDKIEFPAVADLAHPHIYELRFDHVTQSASLWIDGHKMSSGYRGHHQFLEGRGLMFGTVIYGNAERGSFVFRTVRFEAD